MMISVIQAQKGGDICALCGKPIKPSTVFVLKHARLADGTTALLFVHLTCNAYVRGARPQPMGLPGPRRC